VTFKSPHTLLTFLIASVWLINGLVCKVLNLAPRHEQIVANIVNETYARPITVLIGISEIILAVWIWSRYQSKLNAIAQMMIVATMNILEFILVPELLLWGRLNAVFALAFIGLIYYNEFVLNKPLHLPSMP
jgi:hypothetical protein